MEPTIEALDTQIRQTDTVKSLHERDDEIVKDYCSGFFENWARWKKPILQGWTWSSFSVWEVFPLSELCKEHDKKCSTHRFFELLTENKVVGGWIIGSVATAACWVKYTKHMKDRL